MIQDLMKKKLIGGTDIATYGFTAMKIEIQKHFEEKIHIAGKENVVTLHATDSHFSQLIAKTVPAIL